MEGITKSAHSCMASSPMASENTSVRPSFRTDTLSQMKEFGEEAKPSLISKMYQGMKNFYCAILSFIFCVKSKHDFKEAIDKSYSMMKNLGEHDWHEVYLKCGDSWLEAIRVNGSMSGACTFQDDVKEWFEKMPEKDRKGELSIVICPMDVDPGIWKNGVKIGDCIRKTSKMGEVEFDITNYPQTFDALKLATTQEQRFEILAKL